MTFIESARRLAAAGLVAAGCAAGLAAIAIPAAMPAYALSEIQREDIPPPGKAPAQQDQSNPTTTVPMPDPIERAPLDDDKTTPPQSSPGDQGEPATAPADNGATSPRVDPDAPPPEVIYDLSKLPEPVRKMHDELVAACESGDIQKLRPLIEKGDSGTQLSLTEIEGDEIDFLKSLSGDPDGQEILAIMEEVLNAGYVHLDVGTPQELYVWPYFFALPLDKLDAKQKVELFKLVTSGDYDDMKQFGAYIFYRVGITPQGKWAFFVAGD